MDRRRIPLAYPLDLARTLAPLQRGPADPTMHFRPDGVWRATRTSTGAATVHIRPEEGAVVATAWGPGAEQALGAVPAWCGALDHPDEFAPGHPLVGELVRRHRGVRIPRTGAVFEALVPTILEQKVQAVMARRSYAGLVRAYGEPAPGPADAPVRLAPSPERLAGLPYWAFHRFDVERRRAEAIRRAASVAGRLEEATTMTSDAATRRLCAVPGVGPWSAAEVALVALGDADAVPVGDFHLPHMVSYALAGEPRGSDARMLELLEPFRGHRGRVIRLLGAAGAGYPSYGPRLAFNPIRHH